MDRELNLKVVETTLGTGPFAKPGPFFAAMERLLRSVIPAANPDFERLYPDVAKWWVEIDDAGVPQRELGFNEAGQAIVASPLGNNFGIFTDTSEPVFDSDELSVVEHILFQAAWNEFEARWERQ